MYTVNLNTQWFDYDNLNDAKNKAKELGPGAVLYIENESFTADVYLDGITTNIGMGTSGSIGVYGGGTAVCDSTNLTVDGLTISGVKYVYGGGNAANASTLAVTGDCVLTVKGTSNLQYVGGFYRGIHQGDVTVNIEGNPTINGGLYSMGPQSGTVEGKFTFNVSGGRIVRLIMTSSAAASSANFNGGLYLNFSGGTISNLNLGWNSSASQIKGGLWYNITGGTFASTKIYFTDSTHTTVEGGIHITIDGYDNSATWFYGAGSSTSDGVEITMKSGAVNFLGGVSGNQTCDVSITMEGGFTNYITGAAYENNTLTGDVTINVTGGTIAHTFNAAGNKASATLVGDVVSNIEGGLFTAGSASLTDHDFNISGSGKQEGDATMNISGGTFTGTLSGLGKRTAGAIKGNMTLNMTGGLFTSTGIAIIGGSKVVDDESGIEGNVELNISGGSIAGSIYLLGGTIYTVGDSTLNLGAVGVDGSVYAGVYGEGYLEGNRSITVDGTVIGGVLSGGSTGDGVLDVAAGFTNTLTVGSAGVTVTGAVSDFDKITISAGATITAGSVTAAAITAEAATAQGLYTLATGFAAQASVITVVNGGGSTLGTVTLSDSVTSGTFSAGGLDYIVSVADNALKLQVGDAPVPPTPTTTVAEVILTITDTAHAYVGATGGWKVQSDQSVAWQDISTLGAGYSYLGLGATAAQKAMPDIYVYNAEAKFVGAYVTDDTGAVASFESIFSGEAALMQVGIADFNADGVSDLLLRTADGFVGYYAAGQFSEVQGLGTEWTVAALGDVDGNGRADVIIAHEAGYVGAYLVGNDGAISWADLGNLDSNTQIVGAGDVNGDGTDDVIVQVGANYFGAWTCTGGAVSGFFGIGEFAGTVQDIADYNADSKDDLLFRTADGVVGAALISGADATTWAEYGALGAEWSTKGVGIL